MVSINCAFVGDSFINQVNPCPCHSAPMEFEPGAFAGDCDICGNALVYTSGGHGGLTHAFEGRKTLWLGESKSKLSNGKWPQHAPRLNGKTRA